MIARSQRHLAIIDYPEGSLQQARWSVAAFREFGFEVLLRRDGRCHRATRQRPYLGPETDPARHLDARLDWVWLVPAGALPTRSLIERVPAANVDGMTGLKVERGELRPGRCFRHASQGGVGGGRNTEGWVTGGTDLDPEGLCLFSMKSSPRGGAMLSGLIDPFSRTAWLGTPGQRRWDPKPALWETARELLSHYRAGRWGAAAWAGLRGVPRILASRREDCAELAPIPAEGEFSVTYVLDRLVIAGGVLSVIQLVNELILLGVDARIACLFEDPAIYRWQPLLTRPMVFRSARELVAALPRTDLAVATLWKTAPWVVDLKRQGRARSTVYFLQDYEPWFFPERKLKQRRQVTATYAPIPHRIVKSDWLAGKLEEHGCATTKIPLGLNLDVFHPRPVSPGDPTLLAMARPGTGRRGFPRLAETLRILADRHPRLNFELFGSRTLPPLDLGEHCRNHGIVDDLDHLAELYGRADVFVDTSDFQGFGRCALEAMACGTACVLSAGGGVGEYAQNGVNALLVDSGTAADFAAQVGRLLTKPGHRQALAAEGLKTALRFSVELEAERTRAYFHTILDAEREQTP